MTLRFDAGPYQNAFQYGQNRDQQRKQMLADALGQLPNAMNKQAALKDQTARQGREDSIQNAMLALKAQEQGLDPNAFMAGIPGGTPQPQKPSFMSRFTQSVPLDQPGQIQSAPMPNDQMASAGMPDTGNVPRGNDQGIFQGNASGRNDSLGSPVVQAWNSLPPNHGFGASQTTATGQPPSPQSMFKQVPVDYASVLKEGPVGILNLPKSAQGPAMTMYNAEENRKDREASRDSMTAFQKASLAQGKDRLDATVGEKNDQFYQKEWDKIDKEANPLTASGRTGLGLAAKADYNANRALVTLSKPMVTNQEAANVMADIAQIYQGGSPTEYGMSHQGYNTLYGKITGAIQMVTGKPQDALTPQIQQRLIGVLNEMKTTNKAVFKQQLDHIERTQPKVIQHYSNEWKALRDNIEGGIAGGPSEAPINPTAPFSDPAKEDRYQKWKASRGAQ